MSNVSKEQVMRLLVGSSLMCGVSCCAQVCRRLKPDWPKACYRMAVARLALGRFEDAALAAWEVSEDKTERQRAVNAGCSATLCQPTRVLGVGPRAHHIEQLRLPRWIQFGRFSTTLSSSVRYTGQTATARDILSPTPALIVPPRVPAVPLSLSGPCCCRVCSWTMTTHNLSHSFKHVSRRVGQLFTGPSHNNNGRIPLEFPPTFVVS